MKVIKQKYITRKDIQNNPRTLYVFGDNLVRKGMGGQAKEMRGESNSFGFATKRTPLHGSIDCYFVDSPEVNEIIKIEFNSLKEFLSANSNYFTTVVIPSDGIGTGLSKMPTYAPEGLKLINNLLDSLN